VEELFVHPLVIDPRLAFTSDTLGIGFQDNFVTALEFRRILEDLWRNGWTLVDVHRAATGRVRVPVGRKPLVLSEDDVNYYRYFHGRGLATRLVLDGDRVLAQLPDGRLTDQDVVPLVEQEIARHPQFSADGARGVLAVTGYEGLFGEHDPSRAAARARLSALAGWLKTHGWTFASHSWGHIDLSTSSPSSIAWDTQQWKTEAVPLLGHTDVLIYPFGAVPSDAGIRQLARAGFTIQLDIDVTARLEHRDGAILMTRRHVDGYAFEAPRRQGPFYDVATVRDAQRPPT
jgi:NAD(P)-dependent dehydrogenase (short-subunit alcohol dehydrogenase family)